MKKFKRIVGIVLTVCMVLTFCSCGKETASTGDITTLKMILVGDKPAIYDEIYGKLNEMLREDIGAEVEIEYYNYSDVNQKYPLLFSTGEKFDLVFAADWLNYTQQASKNSYMEITDDMLKEYAPKTYATLDESEKNQARVNGKLFMIPNTAMEYDTYVALIRGDLREKYGLPELETVDDFQKYLEAVAENEADIIPLVDTAAPENIFVNYKNGTAKIATPKGMEIEYNPDTQTFDKRDFEDSYVEFVKKTREFVDKGILPADIVANGSVSNMFENGKAATYIKNLETAASQAKKLRASHPEWNIEIYDFSQGVSKVANSLTGNGMALNRTTKNYGKALQLIDLLRNDKRYFDLTWYGIEGKHWQAEGDDKYISLNEELDKSERYEPGCVWGWKNQDMMRTDVSEIPEKQEILNRWMEETVESDIRGFIFDDTNVKTEITSVTSVASQYGGPLYNGMVEESEIDESVELYRDKLTEAGIDKIYNEVVKQYEAYRKSL